MYVVRQITIHKKKSKWSSHRTKPSWRWAMHFRISRVSDHEKVWRHPNSRLTSHLSTIARSHHSGTAPNPKTNHLHAAYKAIALMASLDCLREQSVRARMRERSCLCFVRPYVRIDCMRMGKVEKERATFKEFCGTYYYVRLYTYEGKCERTRAISKHVGATTAPYNSSTGSSI